MTSPKHERRKYVRGAARAYISSSLHSTFHPTQDRLFLSRDLGEGGIGFRTRSPVWPGLRMDVKVHLPTAARPLEAEVQVAWMGQKDAAGLAEVGVCFTKIRDADRIQILRYLREIEVDEPSIREALKPS